MVAVAPAAAGQHRCLPSATSTSCPPGRASCWGITLLVLLVASINYQLNLGYVLTFLLAGSAVVGMHVCHGTLRGPHAFDSARANICGG